MAEVVEDMKGLAIGTITSKSAWRSFKDWQLVVVDSSTSSSYIFGVGPGETYTSEKHGSDENGEGTQEKPYKTVLEALRRAGQEPFPAIFVDGKTEDKVCMNNVTWWK